MRNRALPDKGRVEHEEERDEIDDAAEPHRLETGLHRRRLGDRRGGIGAQRDRRRDKAQHAPVEDEHMDRHRVHAALDQGGRKGDGEEHVGRGHRHADAEDEAGERAHQQQDNRRPAGKRQKVACKIADLSRHHQRADNDANPGKQRRKFCKQFADRGDEFPELFRVPAVVGENLVQDDQQHRRIIRGNGFLIQEYQHPYQQQEDSDEIPAFLQRLLEAGHFRGRQALEPVARRIGVDLHEQAVIVQHGRNHRGDRHIAVRNLEEQRHDERGRAHDRRHKDAACGCAGLDAAGIGRPEAHTLHRRNGHHAGGQHVGDDAAAHRAHQAAGEDGDLGRPAADVSEQREGKIEEEGTAPGMLQGDAEDQEADDQRSEGAHRDAEDGLVAHRHAIADLGPVRRIGEQDSGQLIGDERIDREQGHDHEDRDATGAARRVEHESPENVGKILGFAGVRRNLVFPTLVENAVAPQYEVERHKRRHGE